MIIINYLSEDVEVSRCFKLFRFEPLCVIVLVVLVDKLGFSIEDLVNIS